MPKAVLIIDDDPDEVRLFSEALYELNLSHRCLTATSPEDGVRCLKEATKKPDFIFLDLNMPRMSGKEILEQIKSDKELSNVPVIIYTTFNTQAEAAKMYAAGGALP